MKTNPNKEKFNYAVDQDWNKQNWFPEGSSYMSDQV